jgi:oxysterol-binding protein-related protein 3/6/7
MTEMIVGNVMMPNKRYMEPQGEMNIECPVTGCRAELKFCDRAWTSNWYTNRVDATIFDANGAEKYKLEGWYTKDIIAKNLETDEEELMFKCPVIPPDVAENSEYGMGSFAMNLNMLTDEMRAKIPPTDCRLRPDMRLLEEKDVDQAELEKDRLEAN